MVLAPAALDVAPTGIGDRFEECTARPVRKCRRRRKSDDRPLQRSGTVGVRAADRRLADQIPGRGVTDEVALLRRQQRVVAVDRRRVEEVARRRDLRVRRVVHEHRFEVRLGPRTDLIFGEGAERVALVRPLVEVVRAEVERRRARRRNRCRWARRPGSADVGEEGAERRGRRAAAVEVGAIRAAAGAALRAVRAASEQNE